MYQRVRCLLLPIRECAPDIRYEALSRTGSIGSFDEVCFWRFVYGVHD
jgi:hypothetical protein